MGTETPKKRARRLLRGREERYGLFVRMASPFVRQGSDPSLNIHNERFSFLKRYLHRQGSSQISLASLLPDLPDLPDDDELAPREPDVPPQEPSPVAEDTLVYDPSPDFKRKFQTAPMPSPAGQRVLGHLNAMSPIPHDEADGGADNQGGGGAKRRRKIQWTQTEDITILAAARALGSQWDRIAAHLPGRTSDAVRNRFHRLQKSHFITTEEGRSVVDGALAATGLLPAELLTGSRLPAVLTAPEVAAAAESASSAGPGVAGGGAPVQRASGAEHGRSQWTVEEDKTIADGVATFGCKWRQIAELLPGRTDSSVRNRWVRLQQQKAALSSAGGGPAAEGGEGAPNATTEAAPPTTPTGPGRDLSLFSSATPMSAALPTHARTQAGAAERGSASASGTPAGPAATPAPLADRALADALARYAGVEAEAAAAEGLPLGMRQPDMVIDLEEFVSAVHSLKEESFRSRSSNHNSLQEESMRSEDGENLPKPNHAAPAGVKLASAFLATFAALSIGNLAKAAKARRA